MPRFVPPMYQRVRKKTPPVRKAAPAPATTKAAPSTVAPEKPAAAAPAKKADHVAPKESAKKKATKKKAKKSKVAEWSPEDKRDTLYKLAKELKLDVKSRDTKDWIVKELKKATKKY